MAEEFNFAGLAGQARGTVPGMDLPAFGQARALQKAMYKMQIEQMQATMMTKAANMQASIQKQRGTAALTHFAATGGTEMDPNQFRANIFGIASKYGLGADDVAPYVKQAEEAEKWRMQMAAWNMPTPPGMTRSVTVGPTGTSTTFQDISSTETERFYAQYKDIMRQAEQARLGGDAAAHEALMQEAAEIQGFLGKGGVSVSSGFDDQNRQIFSINIGGRGPMGTPTVGMMTEAQKADMTFRSSLGMIKELSEIMQPGHVGIWGWATSNLLDKLAGQAFPDWVSLDRVDTRTMIGAVRERLFKALSADARINAYDIERMKTFLPTDEALTAYKTEQQKLERLHSEIRRFTREWARSAGEEVPLYAMETRELTARYKAEEENQRRLVEGNYITEETAQARLMRLHDEITDTIAKYAIRPRQ
jgi:hypothetical protein